MSFGEQMRRRREELGLTRQQLAQRLGVSVSAVGNYETGVSAPKEEVLLRLFDASEEMLRLGVPALRIISISFPLAGFGIGAGSVFQALGYSVYSMIISLIRQLVVLIPCAYAIGRVTGDVTGVWWAFVIAELVSLTASALYLRRVNRDVIRTL